jgi:two-component system LytT family sensor kinase
MMGRRDRTFLLLLFGLWLIPGLVGTGIMMDAARSEGVRMTWGHALFVSLSFWYLWSALTPAVLALRRRWPFENGRWGRSLAVHLIAAGVLSVAHLLAATALLRWTAIRELETTFLQTWVSILRGYFEYDMLMYGAILAFGYTWDYRERFRERAERAERLEVELDRARLAALESQLQPHFLFNTLHSVSSLVKQNPDGARRMIARLSDLLRHTLETDRQEVSLRAELESLDLYLDIERERLGERLRTEFEIEDVALEAQVPTLILQPLVENAIRHAVSLSPAGGIVTVLASRNGSELLLEVRDEGNGGTGGKGGGGIGLSNTRARLSHLYGDRHSFRATPREEGGFTVELRFPFHT